MNLFFIVLIIGSVVLQHNTSYKDLSSCMKALPVITETIKNQQEQPVVASGCMSSDVVDFIKSRLGTNT